MKCIAPGVWQFRFLWPNAFNAYYLEGDGEGVVVDASTRWDWGFMRRQLAGRKVTAGGADACAIWIIRGCKAAKILRNVRRAIGVP